MGKLKLKILDGLYAVCQVEENFKDFDLENKDFFLLLRQKMKFQLLFYKIK